MLKLLTPRLMFLLACAGSALLMLIALFFQHGLGLEPCPLCYVQRGEVILFGLIALLACLHNPARLGRRFYAGAMLLAAGLGMATAGRQIWLQHLPEDQLPSCLPPLEFMLNTLPLQDVLGKMLYGSSDCAEVGWTLFGLNIAEMSFISFSLMLLWSFWLLVRRD